MHAIITVEGGVVGSFMGILQHHFLAAAARPHYARGLLLPVVQCARLMLLLHGRQPL
jgi:hypothetical protein